MEYLKTAHTIKPLFPLPGLFLFPGTAIPLRIFENRYRQMIGDLLDRAGQLVIGTVVPGHEEDLPGAPPVHPVAGLGEIVRHEKLSDGRYDILVYGLSRVRTEEVESDRLYRKVRVEQLDEEPVPDSDEPPLRADLQLAVRERVKMPVQLPDDMPLSQLTDLLLISLRLPEPVLLDLYSQPVLMKRVRGALQEHADRPIDPQAIIADTLPANLTAGDLSFEFESEFDIDPDAPDEDDENAAS